MSETKQATEWEQLYMKASAERDKLRKAMRIIDAELGSPNSWEESGKVIRRIVREALNA